MANKQQKKFDLHQLLNERSKAAAAQPHQEPNPAEGMEQLTLDVYDLIPSKENFYNTENVEDLKRSISLVGVLQPLLVKKDGDKYRIKAGHRRRLACMALADEGQEQFRYVPCVIRQEAAEQPGGNVNAILDRLTLIFANGFREKTDWEKMEESLQTEALVLELRKEVSLEGRTRSILAKFTGTTEAQLGRYKAIKNNLCPQLMAEFKADTIGVSTVYELSGLSAEYQERAVEILRENGGLTINDAKALKRQEEAARQIPGQMAWTAQEVTPPPATPAEAENEPAEEPEAVQKAEGIEWAMKYDLPGQQEGQEAAQEAAQEEEGAGEGTDPQEAPQGQQEGQEAPETPRVVYVEREAEKPHSCAFCHPDYHREISTAEGGYLLNYEPESKTIQLLDKATGGVETFTFPRCPFCGRTLK